ncbi:hypothetical protein PIIN_11039 [Serendipita indica DSM 11827]|uniref:Uncharacterized protein n=1 Tax=Serendipita indica (strain DSM 11827) TaxID=1109443 RepID=G4U0G1_SERID|nr:hypothetical protein PIIN_11039 [Serendipita indica DSM 11827]
MARTSSPYINPSATKMTDDQVLILTYSTSFSISCEISLSGENTCFEEVLPTISSSASTSSDATSESKPGPMVTNTQRLGGFESQYGLKIIPHAVETDKVWVASYYWLRPTGTEPVLIGTSSPYIFTKKQDAKEYAAATALAFLAQYNYK